MQMLTTDMSNSGSSNINCCNLKLAEVDRMNNKIRYSHNITIFKVFYLTPCPMVVPEFLSRGVNSVRVREFVVGE